MRPRIIGDSILTREDRNRGADLTVLKLLSGEKGHSNELYVQNN